MRVLNSGCLRLVVVVWLVLASGGGGVHMAPLAAAETLSLPETTLGELRQRWQQRVEQTPSLRLEWTDVYDAPLVEAEARAVSKNAVPAVRQSCALAAARMQFQLFLPGDSTAPLGVIKRKPPLKDFKPVRESAFSIGSVPPQPLIEAHCWIDAGSRTDAVWLGDGIRQFARIRARESAFTRQHGTREEATVRAVLMALRPEWLLPDESLGRDETAPLPRTPADIGGAPGLLISWREPDDEGEELQRELWVDPAQGFAVRRSLTRQGSRFLEQIDVQFETHGDGLWLPQGWTIVCAPQRDKFTRAFPGLSDLFRSLRAKELHCSANAEGHEVDLNVKFRPGAAVFDEHDRSWSVISAAGAKGPLPREVAMQWLLELDAAESWPWKRPAIGGAIALAGVVLVAVRRFRARRRIRAAV